MDEEDKKEAVSEAERILKEAKENPVPNETPPWNPETYVPPGPTPTPQRPVETPRPTIIPQAPVTLPSKTELPTRPTPNLPLKTPEPEN